MWSEKCQRKDDSQSRKIGKEAIFLQVFRIAPVIIRKWGRLIGKKYLIDGSATLLAKGVKLEALVRIGRHGNQT